MRFASEIRIRIEVCGRLGLHGQSTDACDTVIRHAGFQTVCLLNRGGCNLFQPPSTLFSAVPVATTESVQPLRRFASEFDLVVCRIANYATLDAAVLFQFFFLSQASIINR